MNAVLYARVSSEKQAEKDLSISAQIKALRKYAADKGYDIVREFVDEAESARTANRPAFQEMVALARSKTKPFDAVLVWKLSRFARNREDSVIYKSVLRKHGVQVISISERVDDSPAGLLLEGVIEVIDEFYSANLSQDARRGLRETVSRGFFPGGTTPTGYKLVEVANGSAKRKTLALDNEYAPIVKRVFDLCLAGNGAKEIAKKLNNDGISTKKGGWWTKASVQYVLKNTVYTGDLVWPKEKRLRRGEEQVVIKDHHPPIISGDAFRQAQSLISERSFERTHPKQVASSYLFSGLLYCEKCGKAMQGGTAKSGQYRYYGCYSRSRISTSSCDCKAINCERMEIAVIDRLQSHVLTDEHLAKLLYLTNAELAAQSSVTVKQIEALQRQLDVKERKLGKLYDVIEEGHISSADLAPRLKKLKSEADQLRAKIRESQLQQETACQRVTISMSQLRKHVDDLRALLLEGEYFEQRGFLKSFIKRIDYNYPQVTVHYTFPVNPKRQEYNEVLAIDKISGVDETRTRGLLLDRQAF